MDETFWTNYNAMRQTMENAYAKMLKNLRNLSKLQQDEKKREFKEEEENVKEKFAKLSLSSYRYVVKGGEIRGGHHNGDGYDDNKIGDVDWWKFKP